MSTCDDWEAVAARGTDPDLLATVVALTVHADGRRAVEAALGDEGLLDRADGLPRPDGPQHRAADAAAATWRRLGCRVALRGDAAWPARLDRTPAPPPWLAWRGSPASFDRPAVAIVGARRATAYGTGVAAWLAEAAAEAGAVVVSGGAVGIDAAAHDAAVDHATTVVLGCGHDVAYPRPHARPGGLFDRVLAGGGSLCSELLPGAAPRPQHVRARNRLVAGLVDVVVVVEGGPRSGSLVTAGDAADAGVEVLAVPGDVRAPGSAAPHRLLAEGAGACTGPDDLLAALRVTSPGTGEDTSVATGLPTEVETVLVERWPRPVRVERLASASGLGVGTVLAALTRARVNGTVSESSDGVRLRRAPHAE